MPEPHPIVIIGDISMDWNLARPRRALLTDLVKAPARNLSAIRAQL